MIEILSIDNIIATNDNDFVVEADSKYTPTHSRVTTDMGKFYVPYGYTSETIHEMVLDHERGSRKIKFKGRRSSLFDSKFKL